VSVLSSCLLHVCSGARTQQSGACQKRRIRRRMRGTRPGSAPPRPADPAPPPLDQWSRPPWRAPGARLKSSMPMPSRSVRPAGNRHSCGHMPPAPPTRYAGYLPACAGLRQYSRAVASPTRLRAKRQVRWAFRLETVPGTSGAVPTVLAGHVKWLRPSVRCSAGWVTGLRGDGGSMRRILPRPVRRGDGGHNHAGERAFLLRQAGAAASAVGVAHVPPGRLARAVDRGQPGPVGQRLPDGEADVGLDAPQQAGTGRGAGPPQDKGSEAAVGEQQPPPGILSA